jgi:endoglucanase
MKRTTTDVWVLGLALSALVIGSGCRKKVSATSDDVKNSPEGKVCPAAVGVISDGEANSNQVNPIKGRGGYWYTFLDSNGSTITPTAGSQGGTFAMAPGGANGTKFAAHMTGTVGSADTVYAGMGFNFVDPKGEYDATAYKGVSFWAKKGPGSTANVRLKVPDHDTDPDGKVCKECFNDFGADLMLTDDWTQYVIEFANMQQMKGWGNPRMQNVDASTLYGMQFQVNDKGAAFDIWVDEIYFTGCP